MKIIAHRSGPNVYPEQTITSARFALYCGADMVEVDVRYSKDKTIVISHDANVNRVFGVDKLVSDMTAQEFLSLRHKSDCSFSSHLFEHYLACDIKPLLIHVKEPEVLDDLLAMIKKYDYCNKVVFGAMDVQSVKKIKDFDKDLKVLGFMPKPENTAEFIHAGADYIRLWENWVSEERVNAVLNGGAKLWIMSGKITGDDADVGVSTEQGLKKLLAFGVDGILINDITVLQDVIESKSNQL